MCGWIRARSMVGWGGEIERGARVCGWGDEDGQMS